MPLRDHCLRWVLCDQVLSLVSPKDTVSNFTGAVIARGVPSNICVPSARVPTGPLIVIFIPLGSIQVPTPSFMAPVSPLAAGPCLSQNPQRLPTPVNGDRLFFFLSGHDPSIVEVLVKGFRRGFPLHYEGSPSSFMPPIYSQPFRILLRSMLRLRKSLRPIGLQGLSPLHLFWFFGSLHLVWFLKKWRVSFV